MKGKDKCLQWEQVDAHVQWPQEAVKVTALISLWSCLQINDNAHMSVVWLTDVFLEADGADITTVFLTVDNWLIIWLQILFVTSFPSAL